MHYEYVNNTLNKIYNKYFRLSGVLFQSPDLLVRYRGIPVWINEALSDFPPELIPMINYDLVYDTTVDNKTVVSHLNIALIFQDDHSNINSKNFFNLYIRVFAHDTKPDTLMFDNQQRIFPELDLFNKFQNIRNENWGHLRKKLYQKFGIQEASSVHTITFGN